MPISFPSSPTVGQQWPVLNPIWEWDGVKWFSISTLGIATPVTDRITTAVGTDDFISFRSGAPNLVSGSVLAALMGGGGGGGSAPPSMAFQRPLTVAFAGDSIADGFGERNGSSAFAWAALEGYPCEYEILLNSAAGGTSTSDLITNQIAPLEALATKPDIVVVQTIQNDYLGTTAHCETAMAYIIEYSERALAAGVQLVVICSKPPKSSSPDVASALHYMNSRIERYCRDTEGNYYWDTFGAWRTTSSADTSGVAWRPSVGGVDAFSTDGTHPTTAANREAGKGIVPVLERYARPLTSISQVATAYDNTNWPYNNLLGAQGLMLGTSGQLNAVNNTGVAGTASDETTRWAIVATSGITVVPTIVVKEDGYRYQQMVLSGTASGDTDVTLSMPYYFDVTIGTFVGEAIVYTDSVAGVAGISCELSSLPALSFNGENNLGIGTTKLHFRTSKGSVSNSGFSTKTNTIKLNIKSGSTVSGTIQIGRIGVFRVS